MPSTKKRGREEEEEGKERPKGKKPGTREQAPEEVTPNAKREQRSGVHALLALGPSLPNIVIHLPSRWYHVPCINLDDPPCAEGEWQRFV